MASGRRKGSRENGAFFPGEKINGKLPLILDCSPGRRKSVGVL